MTGALAATRLLPDQPGVYRFVDARGRIAYLGRATNLRSRVRSYWGDLADRPHLRRMIGQVSGVQAIVCASAHEAAWLERNLLERSLPRWNRLRGGTESPCWLVLADDPRSPGLHLVLDAPIGSGTGFGPYLGYERASLARDALLRLYPLHLTGTRPGSAERAFAEARGVSPASREDFTGRIRALLARDASAVEQAEAALVEARDRAVERLGFETAATIQAERAALAWLTAEQRVASCPADLRIVGWAAGKQFSLVATDGRLDRWTLREVPEPAGRRAADQTPELWREFAERNAELNAALTATTRT